MPPLATAGQRQGISAWIIKPFEPPYLLAAIARLTTR
jgi:two-component system chemotaxis response regulator CheY